MNPQDPPYVNPGQPSATYDPKQHVANSLTVMQAGEVKICDVKRHPIGILTIYMMSGLMLVIVAVLAFAVAPHLSGSVSSRQVSQVGGIVLLILAVICAIYSLIATKVYWGNSWIVTSDSLTQVNQTSLFNRQSSQLSLGNLEDISAEQNGILTHMFNYGVLKVETAGERSKFQFTYCPNPNFYAQKIIAAREAFEQGRLADENQRNYGNPAPNPGYDQPQPTYQQPPVQTDGYDHGVNLNT
jgi:uncharacterized membrane protein YdbT with pleckstrin-like domain